MTIKVCVLMATYQARPFLGAQIESILAQRDVQVRLVISDDTSTDGTWDDLRHWANRDERITVTRHGKRGGAHQNFYDLLAAAQLQDGEYLALSDQDDVWKESKLRRAVHVLETAKAVAVSSSVVSFDEAGRHRLLKKHFPQRRFDYLCEAPGPGSTFVFRPELVTYLQTALREGAGTEVEAHDWLFYALARAAGYRWAIDSRPLVHYRQHARNVLGANSGFRAARVRLAKLRSGYYRAQFLAITRAVFVFAPAPRQRELSKYEALFADTSLRSRLRLAWRVRHLRRRLRDQLMLGVLVAIGFW